MGRCSITTLLCLATTLMAALPAWAQQSEDALLTECYALRREGRNADAVERCQHAVTLTRSARALAQLAITEIALERWADAATHMAAALADRVHPWVQQSRATLDEAMATIRPHVGELHVDGGEVGGAVVVNGLPVGTLPLSGPVFLMPGAASLEVRAGNRTLVSRTVSVAAGQTVHESVVFVAATPAVVTSSHAPSSRAPSLFEPPAAPASGSLHRTLAWVSAGGALAGLGLALAAWRMREGAVSDYVGAACPTGEVDDAALVERCRVVRGQADETVGQWETIATVGLVAGGVLAVTSAVLFAATPTRRAEARTMRCGGGPGVVGIGCAVAF